MAEMTRDSVRQFAETEVPPLAEHIHRHDDLVPESLIAKMGELGYFGMSVPEEYGGGGMGNLPMIIITEELSRCSLAAAGSLITRPEILTKALLKGGTEAQKQHWLPPIAAGRAHGRHLGDRAGHRLRRRLGQVPRRARPRSAARRATSSTAPRRGARSPAAPTCWRCSRAPIPNPKSGAHGLSLFIVPKDPFAGHEFEMRQAGGGDAARQGRPHARLSRHALVHARASSTTSCRPRT